MKRRAVIVGGWTTAIGLLAGCTGGDSGADDSGETTPGGVPVPPEYEEDSTVPTPQEGVSIVQYTGSGTADEALTSFKQSAEDSGWSERGTITVLGKWSGAGFEKDDEILVFHAAESDGEVTVTVVHGPKDVLGSNGATETTDRTDTTEETDTEETPPETDVQGSDISDVPRYPGSVRTEYARKETDTETEVVVGYLAEATFQEVSDFYDDALPSNGWTIQERIETDEAEGRVATKDSKKLEMYWENNSDYEGYLDIRIHVVQ
jgi:hypothetical protein